MFDQVSGDVLIALFSTLGILIAGVVAVLTYQLGQRTEREKLRVDVKKSYAVKLHELRINTYPGLYRLLSDFIKRIEYGSITKTPVTKATIRTLLNQINEWDSQHSIFFSDQSGDACYLYRRYLGDLIRDANEESEEKELLRETKNKLLKKTAELEKRLKSDLVIYDIEESGYEPRVEAGVKEYVDGRLVKELDSSDHSRRTLKRR